jgi:hypothetical protein
MDHQHQVGDAGAQPFGDQPPGRWGIEVLGAIGAFAGVRDGVEVRVAWGEYRLVLLVDERLADVLAPPAHEGGLQIVLWGRRLAAKPDRGCHVTASMW